MKYDTKQILKIIEGSVIPYMNSQEMLFEKYKKDVSITDLRSKTRRREVVLTRYVCIYLLIMLCRDILKFKVKRSEAAAFYNRDHATATYAMSSIDSLQRMNPQILKICVYCWNDVLIKMDNADIKQKKHKWYQFLRNRG